MAAGRSKVAQAVACVRACPCVPIALADLSRFAVARSLFPPTTLKRALEKLGFVQADPIRAPARAQDLTLRHRVAGYRAGDLERRFASLDIEEDFVIAYGFVTREVQALMHPRAGRVIAAVSGPFRASRQKRAQQLLTFVRERGSVHPREVDDHFSHGTVVNYWGGSSSATTHLLEAMHYTGMLRVARRERGIRIYTTHQHGPAAGGAAERRARLDALVDVVVRLYAPLPASSLAAFVRRLRYAVPHWGHELTHALKRARERLTCARVDGGDWYWPAGEDPMRAAPAETVRLLAPFDPVVHDRARFERLWGWVYRFEAYTPEPKRVRGYYALPLLWRDRVIGWANVSARNSTLESDLGYVAGRPPRERGFRAELEAELDRLKTFLGVE